MIVATSSESGSQLRNVGGGRQTGRHCRAVPNFIQNNDSIFCDYRLVIRILSELEQVSLWARILELWGRLQKLPIFVGSGSPVRNGSIRAEIRLGAIGYRLSNLRDQLQIFHVKLHPQSRPLVRV